VLLVREALRGKVKSVGDLRGRSIGVHSNSLASKTNSHQLLELVLRQHGVSPDDVRVVTVGQRWQSEMSMLSTGAADAVMGDEPHASRMIESKIAYSLMHLGNPGVAEKLPGGGFLRGALIGRSDRLQQDSTRSEAMVRVIRRTLKWLAEHSPEEIIARAGIQDPEERRHFLATLKRFPRQYSKDGRFSTKQLKETEVFFRTSQAANPAARALAIESMVVDRFAGRKE
jgi:NitT/TauT family transport system substrate-binding protein